MGKSLCWDERLLHDILDVKVHCDMPNARHVLMDILNELPEIDKNLIDARYDKRMKFSVIAFALGFDSPKAASTALRNLLERLRTPRNIWTLSHGHPPIREFITSDMRFDVYYADQRIAQRLSEIGVVTFGDLRTKYKHEIKSALAVDASRVIDDAFNAKIVTRDDLCGWCDMICRADTWCKHLFADLCIAGKVLSVSTFPPDLGSRIETLINDELSDLQRCIIMHTYVGRMSEYSVLVFMGLYEEEFRVSKESAMRLLCRPHSMFFLFEGHYFNKEDLQPNTPVEMLGLSEKTEAAVLGDGILTVSDLLCMNHQQLRNSEAIDADDIADIDVKLMRANLHLGATVPCKGKGGKI